jgi:hypothetical protein
MMSIIYKPRHSYKYIKASSLVIYSCLDLHTTYVRAWESHHK